jgi:hypothetical protein
LDVHTKVKEQCENNDSNSDAVKPTARAKVGALEIRNALPEIATLNAQNILYPQSDLASLEERLLHLDAWADLRGREEWGNDIWALPRSWRAMRRAGDRHDEKEKTLR